MTAQTPGRDCALCPRLRTFIVGNRKTYPDFFNAPVPPFGDEAPRLLIVGLAPGLKGANRTGRPFTGDYAGDLLYSTLAKYGWSKGTFAASADDGVTLHGVRITNAVKCVPPENKPTPAEIKTCRRFLVSEIDALPSVRAVLALGLIAHNAVLASLGRRLAAHKFAQGAQHDLGNGRTLFDSYHCSRYNTNTGRLTTPMFHAVFDGIKDVLATPAK